MKRIIPLLLAAVLLCACAAQSIPTPAATAAPPATAATAATAPAATVPAATARPTPAVTPTVAPQLTPAPELSVTPRTGYVCGEGVRLRSAPGTNAEQLATLVFGQQLAVYQKEGDWYLVQKESLQGYVHKDYIADTQPTPRPAAPVQAAAPRLKVYKSARRLEIYDGDTLAATYPIGLGWEPTGHKQREGDGRTPEGEYYICLRNGNSSYYLSLGLSYPNATDARAALADGRIDRATCTQIEQAIAQGKRPPWNTPLGGQIMIHGEGSSSDWTAGCIAVENDVMDILWDICRVGTKVTVYP